MKTLTLTFAFICSALLLNAQTYSYNADDFTTKSKALWEAAKKRFPGESGDKVAACGGFASCTKAVTQFEGGNSCIALDSEKIKHHLTVFNAGSDEAAAIATFEKMRDVIKGIVTDKFPQQQEYNSSFYKYMLYYFEFSHEIFSHVAKQPSAKIGLKKDGDNFVIEVYFVEPVFKA